MGKTKENFVLILLCAACLLGCAGCEKDDDSRGDEVKFEIDKVYERGPLTAHVKVSKNKITIAETLLLEFEAAIKGDYQVQMPRVEELLQNFGLIDWYNLGDTLDEKNNIVTRYRYRLEPFLSGSYELPAFTFEFHDPNDTEQKKHELVTEAVSIEVASLLGEDRAELVIADIEDVVKMKPQASYWWIGPAALGIGILAAAAGWLYLRKGRGAKLVRIFKPAHEIAYARLRTLVKDNLVAKGQIKEFYDRISDILRHYIEHRFKLRAPERTTEEFLAELQLTEVLGGDDKDSLGEFLMHCDLVKFAKHEPEAEQIQQTFDLVKDFIEKTKSDETKIDVTERLETDEPVEVGSV